jgi:hypothetical protein
MDATTWLVIALVIVVLAVLGVAIAATRRRRTAQVRERFGPEYDRAVETRGGPAAARDHLEEVAERRNALELRPLPAEDRERYVGRWQEVQADFVDHPGRAVDAADVLVIEVMRGRGYPVDDFDSRSELLAADHPAIVENYRAAHDARRRHHEEGDTATTEELRRAMVHYRELFAELLDDGTHVPRHSA